MISADDSEELRGMKSFQWREEGRGYPNKYPYKSKWSALPRQPQESHKLTVPLHLWMQQRGMLFGPYIQEGDVWWEPSNTYHDTVGEVIV